MAETRFIPRLCAFIAGSIALHSFMLLAYTPGGQGRRAQEDSGGHIIQAALAPLPAVTSPSEADNARPDSVVATSGDSGEPSSAPVVTTSRNRRSELPRPDKWYAATELEVLAEPLAPAKLLYPEEHIPQAIITRVRVRLFVDEGGVVRKLEVVESGAEPAFEAAARKAWESMRFSPAIKGGVAVKSQKLLELEFLPF